MSVDAIASLSTTLHMTNVMQQVDVSTAKMTMDTQEQSTANLVQDMMPTPSFGHKVDVLV